MHTPSPSHPQRDATVEIVDYVDSWPLQFDAERILLEDVLGAWLAGNIEHIGSTAVPELPAKPVIDIMAPVRSLKDSVGAIAAAETAGYCYHPYKADLMHWFCKPSPVYRTHHLHLVPYGSSLWHDRLAFRDMLRRNKSLAMEYARLKRSLAERFRLDREAYTEGKAPFVERVLLEFRSGKNAT